MNKKLIFIALFAVLLLVGCDKQKTYEKIMKEYGTSYYEKYQKGFVQTSDNQYSQITIKMLKDTNEYNMSKLSKCNDNSTINLKINNSTQEIESYEFSLNCK